MQCVSCGNFLPPAATLCPICGATVPSAAASPESAATWDSSPFMEYGANMLLPTAPPAPTTYQSYPAPAAVAEARGYPAMPPAAPRPTPTAPPQRKRRGLVLGIVIAAAVIVLLIIGGSGILVYNVAVLRPAELRATATAYANSPAGIYMIATSGKPVLTDSLNGQSYKEFSPSTDPKFGGNCDYRDGGFEATQTISNRFYMCMGFDNFDDFALQVDMKIVQGDEGGIAFRANFITDAFYALTIGSDGLCRFFVYTGFSASDSTELNAAISSSFRTGPGQSNLVTLIARGNSLSLYVNKQSVMQVSDSTYTTGGYGLIASSYAHPTSVVYTNLQIWDLSQ